METAERLYFNAVKGVTKPRTFLSRRPNSRESHTSFLNEQGHSSPSACLPLDLQSVVNSDKDLIDASGKHASGIPIGNSNCMGRFEMDKVDLGRIPKSGYGMSSRYDDSMSERDEIKDVRREIADLNGKHLGGSLNGDRNYDRGGSKSQDYAQKSSEKFSREKSIKESQEYSTAEKVAREKGRFSKTFKRKCNGDYLDPSTGFHEGRKERKHSYQSHGSHERLEHDRHRDQDQGRDRSLDVLGSMKSSKAGQALVGLGAGGTSCGWSNCDGGKMLERSSLDPHNPSHVTEGMHSENGGLPDGSWRAEGQTIDSVNVEHSKLASEVPNGAQVKTATDGRTSDSRNSDMKSRVKSVVQQYDLTSQDIRLTKVNLKVGGVTNTAHANSTGNAAGIQKRCVEGSSVSAKPPLPIEGRGRRKRLILEENSDDEDDKKGQLVDEARLAKQVKLTANVVTNQPIRKSLRIPKKCRLDGEHYVDDDAEKALQNKSSRSMKKCNRNSEHDEDEECKALQCRSSRIPKKRMLDTEYEVDDEVQQHKRKRKKSNYQTDSEQIYCDDAEEAAPLGDEDVEKTHIDLEVVMKRSKRKGVGNSTADDNKDVTLTARQRTMQSCKDAGSEVGANLIEFPEGLPQTSQRRRKEKLLEVEQQMKKTEAAQRRKMQLEKAEKAAQAEAIKKILGKDPSKKKRGDNIQRQRDAMEQVIYSL
eukprot:PITA_30810